MRSQLNCCYSCVVAVLFDVVGDCVIFVVVVEVVFLVVVVLELFVVYVTLNVDLRLLLLYSEFVWGGWLCASPFLCHTQLS